MNPGWSAWADWLLHTALGGGVVLLLSWLALALVRQPGRRQWLGQCGVLAAVVVAVAAMAPAWIVLVWPENSVAEATASGDANRVQRSDTAPSKRLPQVSTAEPRTHRRGVSSQAKMPLTPVEDSLPARSSESNNTTSSDGFEADMTPVPTTAGVKARTENVLPPEPAPAHHAAPTAAPAPHSSSIPWLPLAYAAGFAFFLGRWLLGQVGLWRLVRDSQPAPLTVGRLFRTMTDERRRRPRLLVSLRIGTPLSFGLFWPTVVLPVSLCQAVDRQTLRWVFAHELTHLRRGDPWSCLLFSMARAIYFYVPWFWSLCRSVRLSQEYIADAAAARCAGWPEDYAQFLLGLNSRPTVPAGAFGVFGNASDLFRRIRMLLQNPQRVDGRCPRTWALATLGGLTALALILGGFGVRTQAAGPEQLTLLPQQDSPDIVNQEPSKQPPRPPVAPQLPQFPQGPGGMMPPGMGGGYGGWSMGNRLGARLERPSDTLRDQLDLPKSEGLVISQVPQGSAAAKAGFKDHDILLKLNGKAVPDNPWQFDTGIRDIKPDQKIDAVVLRKGQRKTIKDIKLPEARMGGMPGFPGMVGMGGPPGMANPGGNMMQQMMQMRQRMGGPGGMPPGAGGGGFPGMPGMPGGRPNMAMAMAAGGNGVMTTLFKSNDHFTARHQEGNLVITVNGKTPGGKADVSEITVQDGQVTHTYQSLDKVPERYRDKVNNLVDMSAGNNAKIEVTAPAKRKAAGEPLNRSKRE